MLTDSFLQALQTSLGLTDLSCLSGRFLARTSSKLDQTYHCKPNVWLLYGCNSETDHEGLEPSQSLRVSVNPSYRTHAETDRLNEVQNNHRPSVSSEQQHYFYESTERSMLLPRQIFHI